MEQLKISKIESKIVWEKELSDGNFVCLCYRSTDLQNKIYHIVIIYDKITKNFSVICKIDEKGFITKKFKDTASIDEILRSNELLSYLAADEIYSN